MRWRIAIGLSIVTVLLIVLAVQRFQGPWEGQILPNLVTEMIGIILTVTVVDGLLEWRKEVAKRKRADIAYRRMKPVTESLFEPLGWLILGVQPKEPAKKIESIEELLSDNLIDELASLDPEALLNPNSPGVVRKIVPSFQELGNDAAHVVDAFGAYISPEYLDILDILVPAKHLELDLESAPDKARNALINYCKQLLSLVDEHNKHATSERKIEKKMPWLFQRFHKYPGEYRLPDNSRPNETTRN